MADRIRLTQRGYNPKTSAQKRADSYLMNQPRRPGSEPSVTEYESGNPSTWAEDVTPVNTWEQEYTKGRNEIGMGNFLDSTFKERSQMSPSYDKAAADTAIKEAAMSRRIAFEEARKVAHKALHLAHALFPTADQNFIENQARDFMAMGHNGLDSTIDRIINYKGATDDTKDTEDDTKDTEDDTEGKDKKSSVSLVTLEKELKEIKKSFDASKYRDVIASLENRLAALKKAEEEEDDNEDDDNKEEDDDNKESDKESSDRYASLRNSARKLADKDEEDDSKDTEEDDDNNKNEDDTESDKTASESEEYNIELITSELDELPGSNEDMLDQIFEPKTASKPPKKGITSLRGTGKTASATGGLSDLSALWKSDPDVSADF